MYEPSHLKKVHDVHTKLRRCLVPKNRDKNRITNICRQSPLRVEHLVVAQFNTVYIPSPNTRTEDVHNHAIIYKERMKNKKYRDRLQNLGPNRLERDVKHQSQTLSVLYRGSAAHNRKSN